MSLSWEVMREVVAGGGNLIIHETANFDYELARELAHSAKRSGSRITIADSRVSHDLVREIVQIAGSQITIECGGQKMKT